MSDSQPVIEARDVSKEYNLWRTPLAPLYVPLARRAGASSVVSRALREWCHRRAAHGVTPFRALDKVSITVRRGESVAIVGRNGSGKSTLLKILAGTLQPTSGQVEVRGKVAALLELGSGFNPEFTGKENVYLNATVLGLSRKRIDHIYKSIHDFSEIGAFIDQPVKTYSSGMLMRLAFSVMTHVDADVLIVDEALAVGDAFFVQKCMRWIADFQARGTLLFVTHSVGTARSLCSKALWLERGVAQSFGDCKTVTEAYFSRHTADQPAPVATVSNAEADTGHTAGDEPEFTLASGPSRHRQAEYLVEIPPMRDPAISRDAVQLNDVRLTDPVGGSLEKFYSNQEICVRLGFSARENIPSGYAIGFLVKDHLGQKIFGENTWDLNKGKWLDGIAEGTAFEAIFKLRFPVLRAGSYLVDVGINLNMETVLLHSYDVIHLNVVASDFFYGTVHIPCSEITIRNGKTVLALTSAEALAP